MSEPETSTEREANPSRDRIVRLAIFAAAVVFVILYVFVF